MRVEDEEINIVIVLAAVWRCICDAAGRGIVQLEVFADDGFADGRHVAGCRLKAEA